MSDEQTRSLLLVVLGATAIWLWWSGQALNYVRPGLVTWLGVGGVVVGLLGLLPPLGLLGQETAQADRHGGHHQHRGRVGWLLLVPVLVVMLVQPAALGSYAVPSRAAVPGGGHEGGFDPLAAPVRLVGFVAPSQAQEGGYRLTRFVIFCCAADAEALQTVVRGDATPRARDQWLEVERTWQPRPRPPKTTPAHRHRPCTPTWSDRSPRPAHPMSTRSSSAADRRGTDVPHLAVAAG